jgi:hypothetical protein
LFQVLVVVLVRTVLDPESFQNLAEKPVHPAHERPGVFELGEAQRAKLRLVLQDPTSGAFALPNSDNVDGHAGE